MPRRLRAAGPRATTHGDAIRLVPTTRSAAALRQKFLAEHTQQRRTRCVFFVGRAVGCLPASGGEVLLVLLRARRPEIRVPAGRPPLVRHGQFSPRFTALRFFNNPAGWVAKLHGDPIASALPHARLN